MRPILVYWLPWIFAKQPRISPVKSQTTRLLEAWFRFYGIQTQSSKIPDPELESRIYALINTHKKNP
jgi:hypothetical protein